MRRIAWSGALLIVAVSALGCGSAREFAEVEGTVTFDGKPLTEVQVVFVPDVVRGNKGNNASAFTDAEGRYRLRAERDQRDGTVLGPHRVYFVDLTAVPDLTGMPPPPGQPVRRSGPGLPLRFPKVYTDLLETPFKDVEIKSGKQTFNFDLKSKKP
jgi:hypothetical protein